MSNVAAKIRELGPWFHQIEIEPGINTRDIYPFPGPQPPDHPLFRWDVIKEHIPLDMTGMRVLDIGCADGFFALEFAKRGAQVVAIDVWSNFIKKLDWVITHKGIKNIETRVGAVESLDPNERFDTIFMIALLYHLRSPQLGLDICARMTDKLFVETTIHSGLPGAYLFLKPPQEGVHDEPKWFPTRECLKQMLQFAGFDAVQSLPDPSPDRAIVIATR